MMIRAQCPARLLISTEALQVSNESRSAIKPYHTDIQDEDILAARTMQIGKRLMHTALQNSRASQ